MVLYILDSLLLRYSISYFWNFLSLIFDICLHFASHPSFLISNFHNILLLFRCFSLFIEKYIDTKKRTHRCYYHHFFLLLYKDFSCSDCSTHWWCSTITSTSTTNHIYAYLIFTSAAFVILFFYSIRTLDSIVVAEQYFLNT